MKCQVCLKFAYSLLTLKAMIVKPDIENSRLKILKFLHEFRTEFSEFPGWGLQDGLQFCHIGFSK
jgi:hypothetical protein